VNINQMNNARKRKTWITNTPQKQKLTAVSSWSGLVTAASQAELQSMPMRADKGEQSMCTAEKKRVAAIIQENCCCSPTPHSPQHAAASSGSGSGTVHAHFGGMSLGIHYLFCGSPLPTVPPPPSPSPLPPPLPSLLLLPPFPQPPPPLSSSSS
jgi:hypothetical protein